MADPLAQSEEEAGGAEGRMASTRVLGFFFRDFTVFVGFLGFFGVFRDFRGLGGFGGLGSAELAVRFPHGPHVSI